MQNPSSFKRNQAIRCRTTSPSPLLTKPKPTRIKIIAKSSIFKRSSRRKMKTSNQLTISSDLPLTNSDAVAQTRRPTYSVLPFFGVLNMIISCGMTSYKAYINGDYVMIMFVTFVFFATFSLDYCFREIRKIPPSEESPRKHRLKVAIWLLLSTIMFGFACEFSTFMSLTESIMFFAVVIVGNTFLFYVYFIWDEKKKSSDCLINSEKKNKDGSFISEKEDEEENRPLMGSADNV